MADEHRRPALYLYLLTRAESADYDEAAGFVVAAPTAGDARRLVAASAQPGLAGLRAGDEAPPPPGDEGAATWLNAQRARCKRIGAAAATVKPGILLRDFRAG